MLIPAIIGMGLFWRSGIVAFPPAVAKYGGDALWALLVFVILGVGFPRASTISLSLAAAGYSFAIEFSQLYHAPWLETIRGTRLGHFAIGSTFNSPDLIAYVLGIGMGATAEACFHRIRAGKIRRT